MSGQHIIEQHIAAFNARDVTAEPWSLEAELVAPGTAVHGREQVLAFLDVFHEAFPDGRLELIDLVGNGPMVAAEGRFVGIHNGRLRSADGVVEPTGRNISFRWAAIYRVDGTSLASEHLFFDQMDFLAQLGLLPS